MVNFKILNADTGFELGAAINEFFAQVQREFRITVVTCSLGITAVRCEDGTEDVFHEALIVYELISLK